MRWPLLLPVGALIIASGMVLTALVLVSGRENGSGSLAARLAATSTPPSASTPSTTDVRASGDVCQGLFRRPAPGTPRVFSSHYTQQAEAKGITIVAPGNVDPDALVKAQETIDDLFANNSLNEPLAEEGAYVIVTDGDEGILDLPEFQCLETDSSAGIIEHACGIADRADYPVATVNEWDLLGDRRGPCGGLNILYHELGHLVQGWALTPPDYFQVKIDYQAALDAGKYDSLYASTNPNEYFAEATQAYFLHTDPRGRQDRDWLKKYDPDIFDLVDRVYSGR